MKLATHTVVGFPSLSESEKIVGILAPGSEIVELQIPFSDPVADGEIIASANYRALQNGINSKKCLAFAKKMAQKFPQTSFYFMSYYNPIFHFGIQKFLEQASKAGVKGFIIPDLPIEEAQDMLSECKKNKLQLVFVISPNTSGERLKKIGRASKVWVYATARVGITGKQTDFNSELKRFIARIKEATKAEIGVGFGVKNKKDLASIRKSGGEIGIIGSELFRVYQKSGLKGLEKFLRSLR